MNYSTMDDKICQAIVEGQLQTVIELISKGKNVNAFDFASGNWALFLAVSSNNFEISKLLVDAGADVNIAGIALMKDCSALQVAVESNNLDITKLLLDAGATVSPAHCREDHLLLHAIESNNFDISKLLIDDGSNVNAKLPKGSLTLLQLAVQKNNAGISKLLIDAGANVNVKNNHGYTLLHLAVKSNQVDIVKLLVDAKADVDAKFNYVYTPLQLAFQSNNIAISKILIDAGADVDQRNINGATLLHLAVRSNNIDMSQMLINAGADVNASVTNHTHTPLQLAVESNNVRISEMLIEAGANVNERNNENDTLLHIAVKSNNIDISRLLVNAGADLTAVGMINEYTPLQLALQLNNLDIAELLIKAGADINAKSKYKTTPLLSAVVSNNFEITKFLVDMGADLNVKNDADDKTPLHIAVFSNNIDIAKLLVNAGANINAMDKDKTTPLHVAVRSNNFEITKLLLSSGANIHATSVSFDVLSPLEMVLESKNLVLFKLFLDFVTDSNSAGDANYAILHQAASLGNSHIVKLLLDAGADVNVKNCHGYTPLHEAIESNNMGVLKVLIDAGADFKTLNEDKETLLHFVIDSNMHFITLDVIEFLISLGIDVNAKDKNGNTALHKTCEKLEDLGIIKVLIAAGADASIKNQDGETPVYNVVLVEDTKLLKLFIKSGAVINKCYGSGQTPFTDSMRTLSEYANPNHQAINSIKKSLELMIQYTDVNITDLEGKNALSIFLQEDHGQWQREIISKIVLEHVAKLKLMDLPIDTSLLNTITLMHDYKEYFTKCTEELEWAKNTKLHNCWVTFFNLVVDDKSRFVKYAGNEDLIRDFEKHVEEYPIYGETMKKKISKGIERRKLFDAAANTLSHQLPIFDPFHLVVRNTLDILCKKDWKYLCENERCREYRSQ